MMLPAKRNSSNSPTGMRLRRSNMPTTMRWGWVARTISRRDSMLPRTLPPGSGGADLVPVVQIAGDLEAALRVIGDVLADVFEQRAAAHQQQAVAAHHLKREGAEQDPPEEDGDHGDGAAHHHDADGHTQVGVDVRDQPLGEECHAHHQAELLDQDDPRS